MWIDGRDFRDQLNLTETKIISLKGIRAQMGIFRSHPIVQPGCHQNEVIEWILTFVKLETLYTN